MLSDSVLPLTSSEMSTRSLSRGPSWTRHRAEPDIYPCMLRRYRMLIRFAMVELLQVRAGRALHCTRAKPGRGDDDRIGQSQAGGHAAQPRAHPRGGVGVA